MWRNEPDAIARLLKASTWAVVGLTGNPDRPAYGVAAWLQRRGARIVPVNPDGADVLGEPGHRSVLAAAESVDIDVVDVFRRSAFAGAHADEAIAIGAGVWFQLGVVDVAAGERVRAAGLDVVMDVCPRIESADVARVSQW